MKSKTQKPTKSNEDRLVYNHIFLENAKFYSGIILAVILILISLFGKKFNLEIPSNILSYGLIASAFLASSSKIKNYKDLIGF